MDEYPDNDVFRRVRVSSELFNNKVWSHSEVKQFLARSGWREVRRGSGQEGTMSGKGWVEL